MGRFVGAAVPNYFRTPFGPGWALTDAFRQAEQCTTAIDEWLTGARSFEDAMADYQTSRDRHAMPFYELTAQFATQEPPPPELQRLLAAVHGNQQAMDQFVRSSSPTRTWRGSSRRPEAEPRAPRRTSPTRSPARACPAPAR